MAQSRAGGGGVWAATAGWRVGPTWEAAGRRLGAQSASWRQSSQAAVPVEENGLSGEAPPFIAAPRGRARAQGGTRLPPGRAVPMLPLHSPHKGPVLYLIFLVPRGSPNALGRCMTAHFTREGKEAQRG